MELDRVEIKNFRSIPEATIFFDQRCKILVGINEAGKSNFLKALSLLSPDFKIDSFDIREHLPNEEPVEESEVLFIFKLSNEDLEKIFKKIKNVILTKKIDSPIIEINDKKLNLLEFMKKRNEVLYEVNLISKEKNTVHWDLEENNYKLLANWKKKIDKTIDKTIKLNEKEVNLKDFEIINRENFPKISEEYLENIDASFLNDFVGKEYIKFLNENLPKCIFWKYDKDYLLPSKIDLNEFSKNPKSCKPLMNMFNLAGYEDVSSAFTEVNERNPHLGVRNLLNKVSQNTTDFFRNIWKEYGEIEFKLDENGNFINASIKEKNQHGFDRRSDGFKRFITFLLAISIGVERGKISNSLILIDEPDISLHSTACEFLKKELLKISQSNYVLYATHSIFMFDKENIQRHLIVKRENEKTQINSPKDSEIYDDEVLFKEVNYSTFKILKEKNILFEGWRDKVLFHKALSKIPDNFKMLEKKFQNIGLAHAQGVSSMKNISPVLQFANRKCLILSDNDSIAKLHQKKFNENHLHGNWKRYNEILGGTLKITAEDFIKREFIKEIWNNLSKYPLLKKIQEIPKDNSGVMFHLKECTKEKYSEEDTKKVLRYFKEELFNKLKPEHIEEDYYTYLSKVASIL